MDSSEQELTVIKRNGIHENVSFDKILKRVRKLGNETTPPLKINYGQLVMKVIDQLYPDIKTHIIDELTAEQCASMCTKHPDYGELASRIIVSNNHKNTSSSFSETMDTLYQFKDIHNKRSSLIHEDLWKISQKYKDEIEKEIDYNRDYFIDYFGFKTLERAYLMKIDKKIIERPQHMWMRVAIGIHGDDLKSAFETYFLMSNKFFTHATPTLFNAGTPRPQLSSCYLIGMEDDSIDGIYNTLKECAKISKWAGGIGLHIHNVRATGSHIRGTNGNSNGIVPMLSVFNQTARYVDQGGGKRNGSFAIYIEPWHADIQDFLDLKLNHGDEQMRARDLFYALWIPSLFMEKVKANQDWSLFCPDSCPGLSNCYGEDFNKLYETCCNEGKAIKTIKARDLWYQILDSQMETGTPYLLYKDPANAKSNQKNLGVIKSSNLCVAPETKILTDKGHIEIQTLENNIVNVWNGKEFNEVEVKQTNNNSELITVIFSDGAELTCTKYHKFYIQNKYKKYNSPTDERDIINTPYVSTVEAQNLKKNMKIIKCEYPVIDVDKELNYAYTNGFFSGDGTYNNPKHDEVKCQFKSMPNKSYCKRHINYQLDDKETEYCEGISYRKKPIVTLYGEKILLLKHLNYTSVGKELDNKLNVTLNVNLKEKFYVPMNYSLKSKLDWFSGYCDADGSICHNGNNQSLQVSSIQKDFLLKTKLMLQTCGISPKVTKNMDERLSELPDGNGEYRLYQSKTLWRLMITSNDLMKLLDLGFTCKRLKINKTNYQRNARRFVTIVDVISNNRYDKTYCFNETKRHAGIFNGVITSNCTEIIEYSDSNQTAVCNLASIGLSKFVKILGDTNKPILGDTNKPILGDTNKPIFDYDYLHHVTKVVTRNLDKIIDVNFYPTQKTRISNLLHRPIGIGVQGLADAFILLDVAYHSEEAKEINKLIFETMYHASLECSNEIAMERKNMMNKIHSYHINDYNIFAENNVIQNDYSVCREYKTNNDITKELEFCRPIPPEIKLGNTDYAGAYSSFMGSPISNGEFQFDMWGVKPSSRYNWQELREKITKYGMRNSLLLAPMPTASTSQILGNNECFEPFTSNIYTRRTLAGEFVMVNKYLMRELIDLGIWSNTIKDSIIVNKGSIQHIEGLSDKIKEKYKIVWEIPMKHMIDMSADRGAFICQSQSLNLWMEDPDYKSLTSMHFYAWQKGLKTGIYYLRRKPKHQPQQFTIDPNRTNEIIETEPEICDMCSG